MSTLEIEAREWVSFTKPMIHSDLYFLISSLFHFWNCRFPASVEKQDEIYFPRCNFFSSLHLSTLFWLFGPVLIHFMLLSQNRFLFLFYFCVCIIFYCFFFPPSSVSLKLCSSSAKKIPCTRLFRHFRMSARFLWILLTALKPLLLILIVEDGMQFCPKFLSSSFPGINWRICMSRYFVCTWVTLVYSV